MWITIWSGNLVENIAVITRLSWWGQCWRTVHVTKTRETIQTLKLDRALIAFTKCYSFPHFSRLFVCCLFVVLFIPQLRWFFKKMLLHWSREAILIRLTLAHCLQLLVFLLSASVQTPDQPMNVKNQSKCIQDTRLTLVLL